MVEEKERFRKIFRDPLEQVEAGKNFGRGMDKTEDRSSQNFDFTYLDEPEPVPMLDPTPIKVNTNETKASEQAAKIVGTNRQYVSDAKFIVTQLRQNFEQPLECCGNLVHYSEMLVGGDSKIVVRWGDLFMSAVSRALSWRRCDAGGYYPLLG